MINDNFFIHGNFVLLQEGIAPQRKRNASSQEKSECCNKNCPISLVQTNCVPKWPQKKLLMASNSPFISICGQHFYKKQPVNLTKREPILQSN